FPAVGVQRPAVAEHHWLAGFRTPVLVVDLDAVAGGDGAARLDGFASGLAVAADRRQRQRGGDGRRCGDRAADHGGAAGWIELSWIAVVHDVLPLESGKR